MHNVPSPGITDHAVRVRIRIADWDSTIADPKAPWRMIAQFPGFNEADPANSELNAVFTIPQSDLTSDSSWSWSYNAATKEAVIDYTCQADLNSYCPTLFNPTGETHQSILIELGKAPYEGTKYGNFARASVYRNMEFTGLSSANRVATIDLDTRSPDDSPISNYLAMSSPSLYFRILDKYAEYSLGYHRNRNFEPMRDPFTK